jgi:tartrate-resistant acid phosphatase type 5
MWLFLTACATQIPPGVALPEAPTAHEEQVRFIAFGDQGTGSDTQLQVAAAMGQVCEVRGCDFGLVLGDSLYPNGLQSVDDPRMDDAFIKPYAPIKIPFYAALGNHDYDNGRDDATAEHLLAWAANHEIMTLPAKTYSFSAGPATFAALDTTWVFWHGARGHQRWLDETLRDTQGWKVVFGHHPIFSNGQHGNAGEYEGLSFIPWSSGMALDRFFQQSVCGEADLYLSGHDHNLQWISACGTELIVSGAGAKTTPIVDRENKPNFSAAQPGFVWVSLDSETMTIAFYDESGKLLHQGSRSK